MPELPPIRDHLGFVIHFPDVPKRIVSLVPSQTELLCDLGLEKQLYGITRFCVHPEHLTKTKVRVGGTKNFSIDAIRVLHPDIIVANKEENPEDLIMRLKQHYRVWISDVNTLEDSYRLITDLGQIFRKQKEAEFIRSRIQDAFAELPPFDKPIPTAYLIWRRPYMSINRQTFIHDMMEKCGLQNVFANHDSRYPEVSADDLKAANPALIILSSEPYPFQEKHFTEMEEIVPDASVMVGDGELFSWYGSRLIYSPHYFKSIREQVLVNLG